MLSMGITLKPEDFRRSLKEPSCLLISFLLCYVACPLLGLGLGMAFQLPIDVLSGLVLVGSLNGAQSSNLCTFIARGDVALSVLMTTLTTIVGIVATPLICKLAMGTVLPVDCVGIAKSCLQVVLAPIMVGMMANKVAPKLVHKVLPLAPVVGVAATCLLVASAVAQCAPILKSTAGVQLQFPVFLLHILSGVLGYWVPRTLNFTETQCRTISIETAMKSSAFGFLLAKLHFSETAARLPPAISVIWMTVIGASMGAYWRFHPIQSLHKEPETETETAVS